jgi:hypothetical protein
MEETKIHDSVVNHFFPKIFHISEPHNVYPKNHEDSYAVNETAARLLDKQMKDRI